ncbi:precoat protein [Jatropha leaf curl virus]|uniref:Protein V2 n=1 Tax=Jatropha leaf curl virus TaxID=543876 RepID=D3YC63_9GEMI|nr:precoat protein [Jatropha leaf curl virus]AOG17648.1 AV2 [Jatropha leaf curl virus]AOG17654.1 AV2 [Jatropha leaf curl virus]
MWDPLINEFPETLHGFRCMLAVKYIQALLSSYAPDTVGYEYLRDLISVLRCRDYAKASVRYGRIVAAKNNTPETELRESLPSHCQCRHCPRHGIQKEGVDVATSEQKTVDIQEKESS